MAISRTGKTELIQYLDRARMKAGRLAMTLRFQNREAEAGKIQKKQKKLARQIDVLMAAAMKDWAGDATKIIADITKANRYLQNAIRDINHKNDVAGNVTRALSRLDQVINLARGLLG